MLQLLQSINYDLKERGAQSGRRNGRKRKSQSKEKENKEIEAVVVE